MLPWMCGRQTLAIVVSTPCMTQAQMTVAVIAARLGDRRGAVSPHSSRFRRRPPPNDHFVQVLQVQLQLVTRPGKLSPGCVARRYHGSVPHGITALSRRGVCPMKNGIVIIDADGHAVDARAHVSQAVAWCFRQARLHPPSVTVSTATRTAQSLTPERGAQNLADNDQRGGIDLQVIYPTGRLFLSRCAGPGLCDRLVPHLQ